MSTDSEHRPPSAAVAVFAEALIFAIALYKTALFMQWQRVAAWFVYFGIAVLLYLWVRGLFVGRRWAFLLTLWWNGLGLVGLAFTWQDPRIDGLFVCQTLLQIVSVAALLLPVSRRWYSRPSCWPNQAVERTDSAE